MKSVIVNSVEEKEEKQRENIWLNAVMGVVVGDALGVPVQFMTREEVRKEPVTGMRGYGTFNMPPGTWSDDGSMTYATLVSIYEKKGIDYDDIMQRFMGWFADGEYTPAGISFDHGTTCVQAIGNYALLHNHKLCGKTGEWANGNGALMRIIPVCIYGYVKYKNREITLKQALEYVHEVSALTHNHLRSKMACGIYFFLICAILDEDGTLTERMQKGMDDAKAYYNADIMNWVEWSYFGRMTDLGGFAQLSEDEIKSKGYVLWSLEAAVWSLLTTDSFEAALLKVVNLGKDTDTNAAIAGGLAALYYGYEGIPSDWLDVIIKKEEIVSLCQCMKEEF